MEVAQKSKPMSDEERREKARLASKAYREKNAEEYKKKNLERYYRDKEKKAMLVKKYDLTDYPEEKRSVVEKLIKKIKIIRKNYPELLEMEFD